MKRFYGAILFFIAFLSFGSVHAANRIDSLSMDIFINASGDAHVTEVWNCYATKDTEWYHTYKNVGRSEVKNLVVKDEHNDFFETLTTSKEFILLSDGKWDLKSNHTVKIDIDEIYEEKDDDVYEDTSDDESNIVPEEEDEEDYEGTNDADYDDELGDLSIVTEDELNEE